MWSASALLLVCAFEAAPFGVRVGSTATYYFTGQCSDCTGAGTAQLVLQGYTLGNPLNNFNFVSLTYHSNLTSFTITSTDGPTISGTLPVNLPGPAGVTVSLEGPVFNTGLNGTWCSGAAGCSLDSGSGGVWGTTPPGSTSSVPMLSDSMLVCLAAAIAVAGVLLLRKSHARTAA